MTDKKSISKYDDYSPLYSSRITTLYIQHLEKHYPAIDVDTLLEYAGMTMDQVQDQAHWFNQVQVDKFHEKLVELTHKHDIARTVGQFAPEANMGWLKVFVSGFLLDYYVYLAMERIMPKVSRAVETHARKLGNNKVEVVTIPKHGVNEKRYQCKNRTGFFEGIGKLFSGEPAVVEHPRCFHDGEDSCQYIVTFKRLPHMVWKDILKISYLFSIVMPFFSYFFLPIDMWGLTIIISFLFVFFISHVAIWKEKKYLNSVIEVQKHAAEEQLEEWIYSPDMSFLFKTINQIGAENISSPKSIISNILKQMKSQFPFDYGAILLLKDERQLVYLDDYGMKRERNRRNHLQLSEFSEFSSPVPKKSVDLFKDHPLDNLNLWFCQFSAEVIPLHKKPYRYKADHRELHLLHGYCIYLDVPEQMLPELQQRSAFGLIHL